jgi:hypothetical protein
MGTTSITDRKPCRVSLQQRDLAVMESLVLLRAETLDELHARHFSGLSRKRAVNRLAQLARAGFLSPADVVLFGETKLTRVYTLGPKARTALERRSLCSEHFRFPRWNPTLRDASIPHQVAVNRLGRMIGARLLPEHLLPVVEKDGAKHRPDAVIEGVAYDGQTRLIGIEVDLGHYSRERILGKHKTWRSYPDAATLVFVVPDQQRAARVQGWLGEPSHHVKVLTFDQMRAEVMKAWEREDEALLFGLDVWTGGDAWERERARHEAQERRWAEEDRLRELREARERELEQARQEAERHAQQQAAARKPRRRFTI